MPQHVTALFHSDVDAHKAVDELTDAGFPRERISIALSEETRRQLVGRRQAQAASPDERRFAGAGAAAGGALGALVGGIAALASLGIPGGIVVAGPVAAFLGGAGVGAVGGGLLGALAGAGVPSADARNYAERIRYGDILVGVQVDDPTSADLADRTLTAAGARTTPSRWPDEPVPTGG